jgi:hypothetical protein
MDFLFSHKIMKELQLMLVPAPGAKPEFLATVQPVSDDGSAMTTDATAKTNTVIAQVLESIGSTLVLEGYTRDGWAWKPMATPPPAGCGWTTLTMESTDGHNKLPGFVGYLKERQKSAYGRFGGSSDRFIRSTKARVVLVVHYPRPN